MLAWVHDTAADLAQANVNGGAIATGTADWDSFRAQDLPHAGPSGFMLFALVEHGAWITKAGIDRKAIRAILGNPLIAITMLRHDVSAGLFAPVELLIF